MTSILLVFRSTPSGSLRAREGIDAALLFSAFVPQLSVLFSGDGVWQLLAGQQPDAIDAAPVASVIAAFPEYDITAIHADAAALAARGIEPARLIAGVRPVDDNAIRELLARHDHVLTF
ncbi:MAG: sulfurtransferase complex subunit TusC [Pseudomonadota bacterium]